MTWYLKIATTKGEHQLDFPDQASAEAALDETMNHMNNAGPHTTPVKIAGRVVVPDTQITSAEIWDAL